MLSMGGMGCISVLSNVVPGLAVEMCNKFFAGDVAGAAALQCKMLPLIRDQEILDNILYRGVWTHFKRKKQTEENTDGSL